MGHTPKIKFARLPYGNISGVLRTWGTYCIGISQAGGGCWAARSDESMRSWTVDIRMGKNICWHEYDEK